jgi:hypothetical protein
VTVGSGGRVIVGTTAIVAVNKPGVAVGSEVEPGVVVMFGGDDVKAGPFSGVAVPLAGDGVGDDSRVPAGTVGPIGGVVLPVSGSTTGTIAV